MNTVFQSQIPITLKPFTDKTGFNFMPNSCIGQFEASPDGEYHESYIDFIVPYDSAITGVRPMLKGHQWGDYIYLKIIHPQAGLLGQFGEKFRPCEETQQQDLMKAGYQADVVAGLILRFFYNTKKISGPIDCIINIEVHKKV